MELTGIETTAHNVPGVRKKLPAPFTRPRIDLDGGRRVKREWKDMPVTDVKKGDTVAGFGTVAEIVEFVKVPTREGEHGELWLDGDMTWKIRLHNIMGDYQDFQGSQRVYAFAADTA